MRSILIPLTLTALTAIISSCSDRESDSLMDVAENVVWVRPDSALTVLESLDTLRLRTESSRARFSLLYAMALDRNGIDTSDISIIRPAAAYYARHGTDDDRMRLFYYLGRMSYNGGNLLPAIKSYMQAMEYSAGSTDYVFRGLVASAISDVYARNDNFKEKIRYSEEAVSWFGKAGDTCRVWITTGRLASYYADCKDWKKSDSLYSVFFSRSPCDTSVLTEHLFNSSRFSLLRPDPDPSRGVELFRKAVYEYGGRPSVADYASYAYALDLLGDSRSAVNIFSELDALEGDSLPLMVWKYRTLKHKGDYSEALNMFERSFALQESLIATALDQSVATAQSDYFRARSELAEKDHEAQILTKWLIALLAVLGLSAALTVYLHGRRKWLRRMAEMSVINDEVTDRLSKERDALSDREMALSTLRRKYVLTYKRQYSQLNDLCAEYWEAEGSGRQKERIYAKVQKIVSVIDGCNQKRLESMIDENLAGIMTKLRSDLPDATDNDFRFMALNILGFDAKTIARVMGYTVQSVYTKRVRLRTKIAAITSENRDFYLDFIG